MKTIALSLLIAITFSFVHDNETFKKLHALQGSWSMKTKKGSIGESWQLVNDNHLQSKAYFISGKDTSIYENVALESRHDGIFYTVTSTNQNDSKPVAFKLTSSGNNKFVFENPQHDFPKRIVYEMVNKDSIHAFVDDGNDASSKRSHFYFSKQQP